MTQLTVTGGYANKTLFEQAGVPLLRGRMRPGTTGPPPPPRSPRRRRPPSRWRWTAPGSASPAPAISYGAKYFGPDGRPQVVDAGFKAFASRFVSWNKDGTMDRDVWAAQGGSTYQDALEQFINAKLVLYYSGSWQVARLEKSVGRRVRLGRRRQSLRAGGVQRDAGGVRASSASSRPNTRPRSAR